MQIADREPTAGVGTPAKAHHAVSVNRVQPDPTAGKLTHRGSPHALLHSWTLTLLFSFLSLAFLTPSIAQAEPVCPNEAFRTGPSAHLPDCRAYELVTPPSKNGGSVNFTGIGVGGETVTFTSNSGFAGPLAGEDVPAFVYAATRSPEGWQTFPAPASERRYVNLEGGFNTGKSSSAVPSADARTRVFDLHELGQPDNTAGLYLVGPGGSSLVEVGPAAPPGSGSVLRSEENVTTPVDVVGLSADASRVVFQPEAGYEWPGIAGAGLQEYIGAGNRAPLPLVPDPATEADGCPHQILGGQLGIQKGGGETWTHNAISTDGQTVFFTDSSHTELNGGVKDPACRHQLFARIDNGEAGAETVAISEPSPAACSACDLTENEQVAHELEQFKQEMEKGEITSKEYQEKAALLSWM
jgi:hypothetical protein